MCSELQKHEINSNKVLSTIKTILKKLLELFFMSANIFPNEFI